MTHTRPIIPIAAALIVLLAAPVLADKTMDQIEKTGKIKLGFREGSIPFAFVDPKVGKHVGFSVDMANELAKYLGLRFGKTIEIVPFTVTPKTRIPMVVNGTIDVEMGSTTYTQKREEQADFSMIFFLDLSSVSMFSSSASSCILVSFASSFSAFCTA